MSINPNIVLISGDILTLHPNIGLRNLFSVSRDLGKGSKKKYGIFHTLVGRVGLKKSSSIKNKNKKHGLKMPKIA